MNKKAIIILGAIFVLIVGTLGFLIYQRSKTNENLASSNGNQNGNSEGNFNTPPGNSQPSIPPLIVTRITDTEVLSPVLLYSGGGIAYFDKQGQLFNATFQDSGNGAVTLSTPKIVPVPQKNNLTSILWPARGDDFIVTMSGQGQAKYSAYNNDKQQFTDLPGQMTSVDWLPEGNRIVYLWLSNNKTTLNTANPDATNHRKVSDIIHNDAEIDVSPDGRYVLLYQTSNRGDTNPIILTTLDGSSFKAVVKDGYNLGVKWGPDSAKFLFSKRDVGGQSQLWVGTVSSQTKNLNVNTVPDKSTWSKDGQTVYAAIPGGSAGDTIARITLNSGETKTFETGLPVEATDLFLNATQDKLFFKNKRDGALYYLDVSK